MNAVKNTRFILVSMLFLLFIMPHAAVSKPDYCEDDDKLGKKRILCLAPLGSEACEYAARQFADKHGTKLYSFVTSPTCGALLAESIGENYTTEDALVDATMGGIDDLSDAALNSDSWFLKSIGFFGKATTTLTKAAVIKDCFDKIDRECNASIVQEEVIVQQEVQREYHTKAVNSPSNKFSAKKIADDRFLAGNFKPYKWWSFVCESIDVVYDEEIGKIEPDSVGKPAKTKRQINTWLKILDVTVHDIYLDEVRFRQANAKPKRKIRRQIINACPKGKDDS
jgi:hypothetical protein